MFGIELCPGSPNYLVNLDSAQYTCYFFTTFLPFTM